MSGQVADDLLSARMGFEPLLELGHHREVVVAEALAEGGFQALPVFLGPAFVLVAVGADEMQLCVEPVTLSASHSPASSHVPPVKGLRSREKSSPCPTLNRVSSRPDSGQSRAFRLESSVG